MTDVFARDVVVRYGDTTVVDHVDLEVGTGEWLVLLGPNGAGKSSLIRALAGTVPAEGTLQLDGDDVRDLPARELARRLAVVPQDPVVPMGMRVTDYALLGRTPYIGSFGVEGPHDLEVVGETLERLGLGTFADRSLGTLSGGELQRAVLARALVQEAPLLVLDEPTSALDVGRQLDVLELVSELRSERGLTVLAAMHDLTLAGQYADRVVLLACGEHIATGPVEQVLTEETIARYYGASARVLEHPDGGVVVVPSRRRAAIPPRHAVDAPAFDVVGSAEVDALRRG